MFKNIISRIRHTQTATLAQALIALQVNERARALLLHQVRSLTERLNAAEDTIERRAGVSGNLQSEVATLAQQLHQARMRNSDLSSENDWLSDIIRKTALRLPCTDKNDAGDDSVDDGGSVSREMIEGLPARAREVAIVAAASRGYRKSIESALGILGTKDGNASLEYHVRLTTQALESNRKTIAKTIEILCGGQENRPPRTLTEFATWRMSQILTVVDASENRRAAREAFGLHTDFELRTPPRPFQEARIRTQAVSFNAAIAAGPSPFVEKKSHD
jgi:hypothetical protein